MAHDTDHDHAELDLLLAVRAARVTWSELTRRGSLGYRMHRVPNDPVGTRSVTAEINPLVDQGLVDYEYDTGESRRGTLVLTPIGRARLKHLQTRPGAGGDVASRQLGQLLGTVTMPRAAAAPSPCQPTCSAPEAEQSANPPSFDQPDPQALPRAAAATAATAATELRVCAPAAEHRSEATPAPHSPAPSDNQSTATLVRRMDEAAALVALAGSGPDVEDARQVAYLALAELAATAVSDEDFTADAEAAVLAALRTWRTGQRRGMPTVRLEKPLRNVESLTLGDTLASLDDVEGAVVDGDADAELAVELRAAVRALPPRTQAVLSLTFGLAGTEPLPPNATAFALGLEYHDVPRILTDAVRTLHQQMGTSAALQTLRVPSGLTNRARAAAAELLADPEWLRYLYLDLGWSVNRLARGLHCSHQRVRDALDAAGVTGAHPHNARLDDTAWLRQQVADGHSDAQIADEAGCRVEAVRLARRRAFITRSPQLRLPKRILATLPAGYGGRRANPDDGRAWTRCGDVDIVARLSGDTRRGWHVEILSVGGSPITVELMTAARWRVAAGEDLPWLRVCTALADVGPITAAEHAADAVRQLQSALRLGAKTARSAQPQCRHVEPWIQRVLVRVGAASTSPEARRNAAAAAAAAKDAPVVIGLLHDPDASVRATAARHVAETLKRVAIGDPEPMVRLAVAETATAPALLVPLCADVDAATRRTAARRLPAQLLPDLLDHVDPTMRAIAATRLGPDAPARLLHDPDAQVRYALVTTLPTTDIVTFLSDPDPSVRHAAMTRTRDDHTADGANACTTESERSA